MEWLWSVGGRDDDWLESDHTLLIWQNRVTVNFTCTVTLRELYSYNEPNLVCWWWECQKKPHDHEHLMTTKPMNNGKTCRKKLYLWAEEISWDRADSYNSFLNVTYFLGWVSNCLRTTQKDVSFHETMDIDKIAKKCTVNSPAWSYNACAVFPICFVSGFPLSFLKFWIWI